MNFATVDAFDLPEWLGTEPVTWAAVGLLDHSPHVRGDLTYADGSLGLDLLAVDVAYPAPVCPEVARRSAHQAWRYGEVVLLEVEGRIVAGVPASQLDVDLVCEALRRVAKAVGAPVGNFTVSIAL
ncbi:MAG: hypothetical protein ACR2LE_00810 [Nocardioidaceae bacterium]